MSNEGSRKNLLNDTAVVKVSALKYLPEKNLAEERLPCFGLFLLWGVGVCVFYWFYSL